MSKYKFFSKNSSMFVFALVLGVALAVGATTWATSIGTDVSVTGNLSNGGTFSSTGASTFSGSNTFGDAAADVNLFTGTINASSTALITGTTTLYAALTLGSLSEDPTGKTGMIYYNSTGGGSVRLYNGSSWGVIGTSTGLALNGSNIRLSSISTGFLTLGTTTPVGASLVTLEATSTAAIPLTIRAIESQTANLFQVANNLGANLLNVSSGGNLGLGTSTPSNLLSVHGGGYISNNLFVGGTINSTSSLSHVLNYASTTSITSANGSMFATSAGNVGIGLTTVPTTKFSVLGTASSTGLVLGGGTTMTRMVTGVCNASSTSITEGLASPFATSTGYAMCTDATGVDTDHRVFVMATSSLPENITIVAASSTAINTLSIKFMNHGKVVNTSNVASQASGFKDALNFWALR